MKNLSKALRLNKRSIQILDDKALIDVKGGLFLNNSHIPKTCLEESCKETQQ